jgi:hypothetical protein
MLWFGSWLIYISVASYLATKSWNCWRSLIFSLSVVSSVSILSKVSSVLTAKDINCAECDGANQNQRQNLAEGPDLELLIIFDQHLVQVPYADSVERVPYIEEDIETPCHWPKLVAVRPHCEPQHQGKPNASANPSKS